MEYKIVVPAEEANNARKLGLRWNVKEKLWHLPRNLDGNDRIKALKKYAVFPQNSSPDTAINIAVPFEDNNNAKQYGARWDCENSTWYIPDGLAEANKKYLLEKYWQNPEPVRELVGEDRTFGGNQLFIDLIPSSCWFTNVRYCVHHSEWDRLRKFVYKRANYTCECCGVHTKIAGIQLDAHERWSYDETTKTQKLMRIIALCTDCHTATHMGLAQIRGVAKEAEAHICKVRQFTKEEFTAHEDEAWKLYSSRSKIDWNLDLSIIESSGIKLANPVEVEARRNISRDKLAEQHEKLPQPTDTNANRKENCSENSPSSCELAAQSILDAYAKYAITVPQIDKIMFYSCNSSGTYVNLSMIDINRMTHVSFANPSNYVVKMLFNDDPDGLDMIVHHSGGGSTSVCSSENTLFASVNCHGDAKNCRISIDKHVSDIDRMCQYTTEYVVVNKGVVLTLYQNNDYSINVHRGVHKNQIDSFIAINRIKQSDMNRESVNCTNLYPAKIVPEEIEQAPDNDARSALLEMLTIV